MVLVKIRSGFVSNSSSSSFVVCIKSVEDFVEKNKENIINQMIEDGCSLVSFDDDVESFNDLTEDQKTTVISKLISVINRSETFFHDTSSEMESMIYDLFSNHHDYTNIYLISSVDVDSSSGSVTYVTKDMVELIVKEFV